MKTDLKLNYTTALFFLMLCSFLASAQQKPAKTIKDTSAARLSADLGVTKDRAVKIRAALNHRHSEISQLMRDSSLSPAERHLRFKQMVMEQRRIVDSITTPAEKQRLKKTYGQETPEQKVQLNKMRQRQATEMNRALHRDFPKKNPKDSVHLPLKSTN